MLELALRIYRLAHGRTRSDTHLGIAYLSVATFGARLLS
jgi:hypothetical protein